MCVTCGCGDKPLQDETEHNHAHHHEHKHHSHGVQHTHEHDVINLETAILAENDHFASHNRNLFNSRKSLALNLLSSPGSGKTTLLEATIKLMQQDNSLFVIEGDQHTELDANRIRNAGAQAYQINTGKTCHLDGHMVGHALEHLDIKLNSFVFIENVGNLICPSLFDLGEHAKVVIVSVTEGEDKPLKYPDMFHTADLVIISKIDLLPYLHFNPDECSANIRKINSKTKIIQLSATTGKGMEQWLQWLDKAHDYYL